MSLVLLFNQPTPPPPPSPPPALHLSAPFTSLLLLFTQPAALHLAPNPEYVVTHARIPVRKLPRSLG